MKDRRHADRLKTQGLKTELGEVLDLSDSGVGVFRKGKVPVQLGDEVTLRISNEADDVEVNARVARIDKVGLFRHEIGFEFLGADVATRMRVMAMAEASCNAFAGPRCWVAA